MNSMMLNLCPFLGDVGDYTHLRLVVKEAFPWRYVLRQNSSVYCVYSIFRITIENDLFIILSM